jgi:hypothetical protein
VPGPGKCACERYERVEMAEAGNAAEESSMRQD